MTSAPHRKVELHPIIAALEEDLLAEVGPGGGVEVEMACGVTRRKVLRTSHPCRDVVSKEGADVVCRACEWLWRMLVPASVSAGPHWTLLTPGHRVP